MDFLVQRKLPSASGGGFQHWEDVAVIRDLTAEQASEAAQRALGGLRPLSDAPDVVRAIKWDHVEEFNAPLANRRIDPRPKVGPGA